MKKALYISLKVILFFVIWIILVGIIPIPQKDIPILWRFWAELFPMIAIIILTIIFNLTEKKKLNIGIITNQPYATFIGIITGIVWLGFPVLVMLLSGVMKIESCNNVLMLWLWFVSVFINVIMQELLVRGYLYQLLKSNYNYVVATIVTTSLFLLMHGGAFEAGIIEVLNVLSMSILMTIVLEYTQSLAAPIIMHFIWNAVGSLVFGGISLASDYPHLFNSIFTGNNLISGGVYKLEGSIIVLITNCILIVMFLFFIKKEMPMQERYLK